jgi:transcriptional regulator with XRE-family HTH domain
MPNSPIERIGKKHPAKLFIREWMARETPTLTQKRLAERMDCEPGTVSKLLNGQMEMTTGWLANFADALDLSVPDLFRNPDAPTRDELLRGYSNEELTSAIQLIQLTRNQALQAILPDVGSPDTEREAPKERRQGARGR